MELDVEKYIDNISLKNKIFRKIWFFIYLFLFRPFAGRIFNIWRVSLLRLFGAKIGKGSVVYASAIILSPWNLEIGDLSCIGPYVELHIDKVIIGSKVTISQRTFLCGGSHDITKLNLPFVSAPIIIEDFVWIAAESFIMMGVTIGEGAIVGARSAVFKDVKPWVVVGGNPARYLKDRKIVN